MRTVFTYRASPARIRRAAARSARRSFRAVHRAKIAALALFAVGVSAIGVAEPWLRARFGDLGWPLAMISVAGVMLLVLWRVRRLGSREMATRIDLDDEITLTREADGMRFATRHVDHFIRWSGVTDLLEDREGVVIAHGGLYFLTPNEAFESADERAAFLRDVLARLPEAARARSAPRLGVTA